MKVTAIVVTYNRLALLKECIAALLAQDYENMDILLVDNHSTDGTIEYMNELLAENSSKIKALFLDENTGGAGGFYAGVKAAAYSDADWLWLMDDDTIPERQACSELVRAVEVIGPENKIGYISSNVYGMQGECMNTPRMKFMQKGENGYADWNCYLEHGLVKVNSATFCACFVSTDAVRQVGLPLKEYFLWGDDTEYTLRLSKYYGQAYLAGKSKVLHKRTGSQSLSIVQEENPNRMKLYFFYVRNYLINLRLYFGVLAPFAKTAHFLLMMLQILLGKSKLKGKKIAVLWKGIFAYWFRRYDTKMVKNRLDINYVSEKK